MGDSDLRTVELASADAADVLALYEGYGWWDGRVLEDVERAIEHSLAVGLRDPGDADGGELVAAARVVTDYAYYARIHDVVVGEGRRGDGLGERLMGAVVDHPALAEVNPTLVCREGLVPFYERCGFERYPETVEVPNGGREDLYDLVYSRSDPAE